MGPVDGTHWVCIDLWGVGGWWGAGVGPPTRWDPTQNENDAPCRVAGCIRPPLAGQPCGRHPLAGVALALALTSPRSALAMNPSLARV